MKLEHRLLALLQLILDFTPGFIGLGKDNCKTRRETFKFGDLVHLISEILRHHLVITYLSSVLCALINEDIEERVDLMFSALLCTL